MPDRKIDTYQEISPLEVIFSTATTDPPGERLYSSQSAHFQKLGMQSLVSLVKNKVDSFDKGLTSVLQFSFAISISPFAVSYAQTNLMSYFQCQLFNLIYIVGKLQQKKLTALPP